MNPETTLLDPGLAERERVLRLLRAQASEIRHRGVTRLRLFGSTARGDAGPKADVDLLAEVTARKAWGAVLTSIALRSNPS